MTFMIRGVSIVMTVNVKSRPAADGQALRMPAAGRAA